jgi:hypothetical protein
VTMEGTGKRNEILVVPRRLSKPPVKSPRIGTDMRDSLEPEPSVGLYKRFQIAKWT